MSPWVAVGSLSGFLAVAFGAFGAHGLASSVDERSLEIFKTGAQYQMYHALALLGLGILATKNPGFPATLPGWAFAVGTVIFSGSLYLLAVTGARWLGAITPIGGLSFMIGWIALAYTAFAQAKGAS